MSKKPSIESFCSAAKSIFLPTILRRVRDKELAAEIFQRTMEVVIKKYNTIDDAEAYTWKVIENLRLQNIQSYIKAKKHESIDVDNLVHLPDRSNDPETALVLTEYNEILTRAIQSLPEDTRLLAIDYLTKGRKYDKKRKTYSAMTIEEFCDKYSISKSFLFKTISELKVQMKAVMGIPA